jgi:DNA-binding MarR family transcriptional regulator
MSVKGDPSQAEPDIPPDREAGRSALEGDLFELLRVMPRVFRGLRHGSTEPAADGTLRPSPKELFKGGGLGPRHIAVVVVLMLNGPMAVSDLAHRLGLSLASVSLMVSELARAGMVDRREDERDRRRTMVSIDERHRVRFEPFVRERIAPLRRALERMPPEIRMAFIQGWRVLAEECEPDRPDPGATPGGGG